MKNYLPASLAVASTREVIVAPGSGSDSIPHPFLDSGGLDEAVMGRDVPDDFCSEKSPKYLICIYYTRTSLSHIKPLGMILKD